VVGQRLMLNSLTGGNSTCHALRSYKRFYHFVFGNPDEKNVLKQLESYFRTEEQVKKISQLTIGVIGEHPPGFYFCSTNESKLKSKTGVNIHKIDLLDSLNKCLHISEKESLPIISEIENQIVGVDIGADEVKKFAKFATYIKSYIEKNNVNALAIRNWPEFFTEFGAAAGDTSISYFTENGIPSANESDIHGALSMYILQEIGEGPPFLGDLVHLNDENNSVTFWHDGSGAFSLANPKTGAVAGVNPNRKLGLSMDFGLKSGEVTIARFSEINNEGDYQLLIMKGEALDTPQQFTGTSVEVRLENNAKNIVSSLMKKGFEPHYALVYADVAEEVAKIGERLGLEVIRYY